MHSKHEIVRVFSFRKPTSDASWYPTATDGTVECRGFVEKQRTGGHWARVCVWGEDDFGLEKDFEGTRMQCIEWWQREQRALSALSVVTQAHLRAQGFVNA